MGEFPSGQRGQTVNLLSVTSVVRIHLPPPKTPDFSRNQAFLILFRHFRFRGKRAGKESTMTFISAGRWRKGSPKPGCKAAPKTAFDPPVTHPRKNRKEMERLGRKGLRVSPFFGIFSSGSDRAPAMERLGRKGLRVSPFFGIFSSGSDRAPAKVHDSLVRYTVFLVLILK